LCFIENRRGRRREGWLVNRRRLIAGRLKKSGGSVRRGEGEGKGKDEEGVTFRLFFFLGHHIFLLEAIFCFRDSSCKPLIFKQYIIIIYITTLFTIFQIPAATHRTTNNGP
jgi:hypothetical protein